MDMTVLRRADGLTDEQYADRIAQQERRAAEAAAERKRRDIKAVVKRVKKEGIIVVPCGKMFAKNMWREFRLLDINRNRLPELVDELVKAGVLTCAKVVVGTDVGSPDTGTSRGRTTTHERLYYLTE